jgi:hypothetical protein
MRAALSALGFLLGWAAALPAQGLRDQAAAPPGTVTVGVWTGVSWHAAGPSGVQRAGDREFVLVALRYRRVLLASARVALAYTADLIPVAVATDNSSENFPFQIPDDISVIASAGVVRLAGGHLRPGWREANTAFGVGAAPVGVEVSVSIARRFAVTFGGTAGFLAFSKAVPFANARKLNATLDAGCGFEVALGGSWRGIGGYKFHHLSNAGTAELNPGLNARVWYLGTLVGW